jgi:hybrid polyketide synthase/nonribosomal peptide synthetase FtdB
VDAERELRSRPPHPLLGDRQSSPEPTWHNQLDARLIPWLADHRLSGSTVLPAAGYLEMAAAAVRELLGEPTILLEDVRFHRVLFLPEERLVPTCVRLDRTTSTFQIFAAPPDSPYAWELHAEGLYRCGRLARAAGRRSRKAPRGLPGGARCPARFIRTSPTWARCTGRHFTG